MKITRTVLNCHYGIRMMSEKIKIKCLPLLLIIASIVTIQCTKITKEINHPIHNSSLPQSNPKVPLTVELLLTEDLRNAKCNYIISNTNHVFPVGENISYLSQELLENVFEDVIIRREKEKTIVSPKLDYNYTIIPKFLSFGHAYGVTKQSGSETSVTMEWKIINKSGATVWVETITGTYIESSKEAWGERYFKNFYAGAIDDLFKKSQDEFLSSKLIRNLR